ncbi:MAG: glycerophosphodiester phosphodiesterase [Victivallales bacterium]|nr:glycerophosphodiester phosphodiesterase [Victivallales bacterium]
MEEKQWFKEGHEFPRLLAHCGNNEKFTENGKMAFEYSLANGATGFETDFRMSADGVIMVIHDSSTARTTDTDIIVEHSTLAELKKARMRNSDEPIPTAEEILSLFERREGFYIELEMKARYGELYSPERMDEYLEKLYALAVRYLSKSTFIFTCFDVAVLRRMKELHPDAKVGVISGGLTQEILEAAISVGAFSIAPTLNGTSQELVDKAKTAGLKVNLWHAETIDLWNQAREMGADVCTTNHPVVLLKEINSR